jgi:hypothetical protein
MKRWRIMMTRMMKMDDVENCRGPDWAQNVDTHTLCELAHRNAYPHVTKVIRRATLYINLREICRGPDWAQIGPRTRTHTLCKPAQSKCMSTCHKGHQKSHGNIQEKCRGPDSAQNAVTHTLCEPRPILGPERGLTLCASLRSRNACQDFTRATSEGNLHVKCRRPKLRCRLGASLRNRNAYQNFTRATSHRNLQGRGPK